MQYVIPLREAHDRPLTEVGGKARSLGTLLTANLPVPEGFCLLTAYPHADHVTIPTEQAEAIRAAYAAMGSPLVAVRSSAVSEDGTATSQAGQQETILGVQGGDSVIAAVERCWRSLQSDRARAYRQHQGVKEDEGLAVVVQRLIAAEVAGVLFTLDPNDPAEKAALVEASYGLGEAVVSGLVTPDRFQIDRESGDVVHQTIGSKQVRCTAAGREEVPSDLQARPCLNAVQLRELAALGRKVEQLYGAPRDVEWAYADGKLWLLQARPITTITAAERERFRNEEIDRLTSLADPRGTVWARYNLAEILPTPTPMTWAVVQHFMSGRGGYGKMLRDLGYDPDPVIDELGFLDLICGRPYVNLSREPKLYFRDFPSGYNFAELKANPAKALYPQPMPQPELVTKRFIFRLPVITYRMLKNNSYLHREMATYDRQFRDVVLPEWRRRIAEGRAIRLEELSNEQLLKYWQDWRDATLDEFPRSGLRPTVFAALALAELQMQLQKNLDKERAATLARSLLSGQGGDEADDLASGLQALAAGTMSRSDFLQCFGHRGAAEMELAEPRWREAPDSLQVGHSPCLQASTDSAERWEAVRTEAKLRDKQAATARERLQLALRYLHLREVAKDHLMMGYDLLRRALVEMDQRLGLRGGIFYLLPEELPTALAGTNLADINLQRRRERQTALSIDVPTVLFSDDLQAIGRPREAAVGALQGTPVSAGVAEGPALVLQSPQDAGDVAGGFILVCPSTDPAWVPLFLKARGLVMETGGVLSHGAIVAREFGLPAVVGLPDVLQRIRTGQQVRVDGNTGKVALLE